MDSKTSRKINYVRQYVKSNKVKNLIETERLLLIEITLDDKEELFNLHSDPEVQKFTGEPVVESIEEIEKEYGEELATIKSMDLAGEPLF